MRKFLNKTILLCLPFVILFTAILIVDPYNYFKLFDVIQDDAKQRISYRLNYSLWKVIQFKSNPCPNILLGDSRIGRFKAEMIDTVANTAHFNFAFGGGTSAEIIDAFWFAVEKIDLQNVYIGINFDLYNKYASSANRMTGSTNIMENPALYFLNTNVIKAAFLLIKEKVTGQKISIEKPTVDPDEFWKYQLNTTANKRYANYGYPNLLYLKFKKIHEYCKKNHIQLTFVIPPTHTSLQKKIEFYKLEKDRERFISDLKKLNVVYNFDTYNGITENRDNFDDPYHIKPEALVDFIQMIWGNKKKR